MPDFPEIEVTDELQQPRPTPTTGTRLLKPRIPTWSAVPKGANGSDFHVVKSDKEAPVASTKPVKKNPFAARGREIAEELLGDAATTLAEVPADAPPGALVEWALGLADQLGSFADVLGNAGPAEEPGEEPAEEPDPGAEPEMAADDFLMSDERTAKVKEALGWEDILTKYKAIEEQITEIALTVQHLAESKADAGDVEAVAETLAVLHGG